MALDIPKKCAPLARVSDPMRLPGKSPTCVYAAAALRYLCSFPFFLLLGLFAGKTLSAQPQQADLLGWWYKDGLPGSAGAGTKGQQKVNARLLNIQGMEIARWEMEISDVETEIPLPAGLPDGLYLLEWKNEQYQWIDRLVIH